MVDRALVDGVLAGDRASIGRALTLVESRYPGHRAEATALLDDLLPHAVESHRVGITGVPGVGKSTFIEAQASAERSDSTANVRHTPVFQDPHARYPYSPSPSSTRSTTTSPGGRRGWARDRATLFTK